MADSGSTNSIPKKSERKPNGEFEKPLFLKHLREHGNVAAAAAHTGCERTTAYYNKDRDEKFAADWEKAMVKARRGWADKLEIAVGNRAVDGWLEPRFLKDADGNIVTKAVRKHSDILGIFLLKKLRPDIYEDVVQSSAPEDAARAIREFVKQASKTVELDDNAGKDDASSSAKSE